MTTEQTPNDVLSRTESTEMLIQNPLEEDIFDCFKAG